MKRIFGRSSSGRPSQGDGKQPRHGNGIPTHRQDVQHPSSLTPGSGGHHQGQYIIGDSDLPYDMHYYYSAGPSEPPLTGTVPPNTYYTSSSERDTLSHGLRSLTIDTAAIEQHRDFSYDEVSPIHHDW
ncbi:hypothetical protein CHU98_g7058 [Xylaria longipes]|nr:hypothetical protein CHU98_g7058 [Xylaria longipes]